MKKNSLDIYWENKLDFKYEEEILRYKMLCNDKISKKLVKKYNFKKYICSESMVCYGFICRRCI